MSEMRRVPSYETLTKLSSLETDEIIFCEEENAEYIYRNGHWEKNEPAGINSGLTLLELNRSLIKQMGPMDLEAVLEDHIKEINDWKNKTGNQFYMLYGKEISYFTLFNINSNQTETLGEAVFDCLSSIGPIFSFSQETDGIEIWAEPIETNEVTIFYLFPYDFGVVEVQ